MHVLLKYCIIEAYVKVFLRRLVQVRSGQGGYGEFAVQEAVHQDELVIVEVTQFAVRLPIVLLFLFILLTLLLEEIRIVPGRGAEPLELEKLAIGGKGCFSLRREEFVDGEELLDEAFVQLDVWLLCLDELEGLLEAPAVLGHEVEGGGGSAAGEASLAEEEDGDAVAERGVDEVSEILNGRELSSRLK